MKNLDDALSALRDLIQQDPGNRGLAQVLEVPGRATASLFSLTCQDFARACRNIGETPRPVVGIVTGFTIPVKVGLQGQGRAETDGPLGALFLVRAWMPLGIQVILVTDPCHCQSLRTGLRACGWEHQVPVLALPCTEDFLPPLTHCIALERVGPTHTLASLRAHPETTSDDLDRFICDVPEDRRDRCYTMSGRDITEWTTSSHHLFEGTSSQGTNQIHTIGIGDGGNEIGMGKLPWAVIARNIPRGEQIACRVPTDELILAGVSNWGAYALAVGVSLVRGVPLDDTLFDPDNEHQLLEVLVREGQLIDGVTGQSTATVDALPFDVYIKPLLAMNETRRVSARIQERK